MTFLRSFHALTYATVAWAFLTLAMTGELHLPALLVYVACFLMCVARLRRGGHAPLWLMTVVSLVAFAIACYGWFILQERMYAVTYFLIYLQLHKLFTARKNRDYLQVFALTFFQVLAASVSTTSLLFAPFLLGYLFLIVASMMTLTVKRDAEGAFCAGARHHGRGQRRLPLPAPRRLASSDRDALRAVGGLRWMDAPLAGGILGLVAGMLLLGGGLFWLIPRASQQNFLTGLGAGAPRGRTGFAETVSFGDVTRIQKDASIIMRVELDPQHGATRPELLRVRGTSLDTFDGRRWTRSGLTEARLLQAQEMFTDFEVAGSDSFLAGQVLHGTITLEAESSGYLFLIDQPRGVRLPSPAHLVVDNDGGSIRLKSPPRGAISYSVTGFQQSLDAQRGPRASGATPGDDPGQPSLPVASSVLAGRLGNLADAVLAELTSGAQGRLVDDRYITTPDISDMQTVADLARLWTEGLVTDEDKALEIQRRLQADFGYSLEIDFAALENHLSHFLRVRREGHCEYFATSMALMLRSLGIESRIVNGYLTDEFVESGAARYIVRQEHAHSWVEARFAGSPAWITFDPTPSDGVGSNRIADSLYHRLTALFDGVKLAWYNAVIDYDAKDQRESLNRVLGVVGALAGALDSAGAAIDSLAGGRGSGTRGGLGLIAAMAVLVGVGAGLLLRLRRLRRPGQFAQAPPDSAWPPRREASLRYLELLDALELLLPRPASLPATRYAQLAVDKLGEDFSDLPALTEAYYRVRFRGEQWPGDFAARASALRERAEALAAGT